MHQIVPDEFNMGLSSRRAIYSPFPQAVPSAYAVDISEFRPLLDSIAGEPAGVTAPAVPCR